jgi:protein-disulfide isomerase
MVLGRADAPVTIIEYASLTCPHCAAFHTKTLPKIKTEFIDTGKIMLVYRDFPLDGAALDAAALAHCSPTDRYFAMIGYFYESQRQWAVEGLWRERLTEIATTFGMDKAAVDACLNDQTKIDAVLTERQDGEAKYGVSSTPTFIINGRKIRGAQTFEQLADFIRQAEQRS